MQPLLYLTSLALVLPAAALATFFATVARVAGYGTLGRLVAAAWRGFSRAADLLVALGPWGILVGLAVAAALVAVVAVAWSDRYRAAGYALVALVAVASTATIVVQGGAPRAASEALVHLPALVALGIAGWQLAADPRVAALVGAR